MKLTVTGFTVQSKEVMSGRVTVMSIVEESTAVDVNGTESCNAETEQNKTLLRMTVFICNVHVSL